MDFLQITTQKVKIEWVELVRIGLQNTFEKVHNYLDALIFTWKVGLSVKLSLLDRIIANRSGSFAIPTIIYARFLSNGSKNNK